MRRLLRWLAVVVLLCAALAPAHARRLALVIGNDGYLHTEKLRNARNDSAAMGRALQEAGFTVTREQDLGRDALYKTIDRFVLQVGKDDEVVFYFAGHGVQIDAAPYLLPIDIRPDSARQLARDALPLEAVLADLSKARYSLVVVDACRNNPFAAEGRRGLGAERGLQPIEPPEGMAVMLSAGRGQTALDSLGGGDRESNGLFTRELVKVMAEPGVPVRDLLLKVRDAVEQRAATVSHKQRPALIDESRGQFFFHAPKAAVAQTRASGNEPDAVDIAYWTSVQERGGLEELQLYLKRFPQGRFADLAQVRIARLQAPGAQTAAALVPPASQLPGAVPSTHQAHPVGNAEAQRFLLLAEKGNAPAMASLAGWYMTGRNGLPRDLAEAERWYRKGVALGHPGAMSGLGYLHEKGFGAVTRDLNQAANLYRQSAELGDPRGMNAWGYALSSSMGGVPRDDAQALAWYRKAAEAGYARAMANLGEFIAAGRGGERADLAAARRWYEKAVEADDPLAKTYLGRWHEFGLGGLDKNEARALELYRQAIAQGEPVAMLYLAYAYANGRGVAKDDAVALTWFRKAAEAGSARAVSELGFMHAAGRGAPQDLPKAAEFYRQGAALNDVLGMNNLADLMARGAAGLVRDDAGALALYRRGADRGSSYSMNAIGVFYRDGRGGLGRDAQQARAWFDKAAALGFAPAKSNLQALR